MLHELRIQNLLLIEDASLELSEGLNVLTGETGAGKTLLATALGLLLGERSRSGLVRAGAEEAWVEGVFSSVGQLPEGLSDLIGDSPDEIVLARRVWPDGRSRALINGRTSTVGDLRDLGATLLSFHGQHEHRKLALSTFQMDAVDSAVGSKQLELRERAAQIHLEARKADEHLAALSGSDGAGQREVDLLRFELDEIEAVQDDLLALDDLRAERARLRSVDAIRAALNGLASLAGDLDGGPSPVDAVASSLRAFDSISGVDSEIDELASRASSLSIELGELCREARSLSEGLDGSPERLEFLEEQIATIDRLLIKHGGSVEAVQAHAEGARTRLAEMEDLDGAIARASAELERLRSAQAATCKKLRAGRLEAARRLAPAVEAQLADLALEGAIFEIGVEPLDGAGPTGADRVEFRVSANPGIAPGPISDVASGGEMSRILLALLAVSVEQGGDQKGNLLVFDEIDAGIGGVTAKAVGSRLRSLSSGRQILCITHLPQVAASGQRHFRLTKHVGRDEVSTVVEALSGELLEAEMVRMLGGVEGDEAVVAHARELLAEA